MCLLNDDIQYNYMASNAEVGHLCLLYVLCMMTIIISLDGQCDQWFIKESDQGAGGGHDWAEAVQIPLFSTDKITDGFRKTKLFSPEAVVVVVNSYGGSLAQAKHISDILRNYGARHK